MGSVVVTAMRMKDGSRKNPDRASKFSRNRGGMQRHARAAGSYRSNLAPLRLEMGIVRAENDARPETVESLIAGKCLVAGVVDEDQKIVGVGFRFLVYGGLHRL